MQFFKFSFYLLLTLLSSTIWGMERFSSKTCLEKFYKTKISSQGPLFGLFPHEMIVNKKHCVISVVHKKYLTKEWSIDVCREPVHMKVTSVTGGVDVAKKEEPCLRPDKSKNTSDFCAQYFELMDILQDDGLIFADGDRDNIETDHGKIYCSYLLLRKYLGESVLFSRYTDVENLFTPPVSPEVNNKNLNEPPATTAEPVKAEVQE